MLKPADVWSGDHLSDAALEQFQQGRLPPNSLLSVDTHLFSCEECQTRLQRLVLQSLSSSTTIINVKQALWREELDSPLPDLASYTAGYPDFSQIADYADGKLPPREADDFEVLISRFPALKGQVEDLRALRLEMEVSSAPRGAVAPPMIVQSPALSQDVAPVSFKKRWERLFWLLPSFGTALGTAALLFLIVISPLRDQLFQSESVRKSEITTERSQTARAQARAAQLQKASKSDKQARADAQKRLLQSQQDTKAAKEQLKSSSDEISRLKNQLASLKASSSSGQIATSPPSPTSTPAPAVPTPTPVRAAPENPTQEVTDENQLPVVKASGSKGNELSNPTFVIQSPQRTKVRTLWPVLRWTYLPGATGYKLSLQDATQGEWVFQDRPVSDSPWQLPEQEPLTRGHRYVWSVEAVANGKTLAQALVFPPSQVYFEVLSEKDEKSLQNTLNNASPEKRIKILRQFKLYEEAQAEEDVWQRAKTPKR